MLLKKGKNKKRFVFGETMESSRRNKSPGFSFQQTTQPKKETICIQLAAAYTQDFSYKFQLHFDIVLKTIPYSYSKNMEGNIYNPKVVLVGGKQQQQQHLIQEVLKKEYMLRTGKKRRGNKRAGCFTQRMDG